MSGYAVPQHAWPAYVLVTYTMTRQARPEGEDDGDASYGGMYPSLASSGYGAARGRGATGPPLLAPQRSMGGSADGSPASSERREISRDARSRSASKPEDPLLHAEGLTPAYALLQYVRLERRDVAARLAPGRDAPDVAALPAPPPVASFAYDAATERSVVEGQRKRGATSTGWRG